MISAPTKFLLSACLLVLAFAVTAARAQTDREEDIRFEFQAVSLDESLYGVFFRDAEGERGFFIPNGNFSQWQQVTLSPGEGALTFYRREEQSDGRTTRAPLGRLPVEPGMDGGSFRLLWLEGGDRWRIVPVDFSDASFDPGSVFFVNLAPDPVAVQMGDTRLMLQPREQKMRRVSAGEDKLLPTRDGNRSRYFYINIACRYDIRPTQKKHGRNHYREEKEHSRGNEKDLKRGAGLACACALYLLIKLALRWRFMLPLSGDFVGIRPQGSARTMERPLLS